MAPLVRFRVYNLSVLPTVNVARAVELSALISKPPLPEKSTFKEPTSTSLPSLGGDCLYNFFDVKSISNKSVVAAPEILLVYAMEVITGEEPPLIGKSVAAVNPVSGLRRRFWPVFVTNLTLSTVGLKSMLANAPTTFGENCAVFTAVALPLFKLIMYNLLVLPSPYNWPVAGLKSILKILSPNCNPVTVNTPEEDSAVFALYFKIRLSSVRP